MQVRATPTARQSGVQPPSINNSLSGLRYFFSATLDRPDLARRLTAVREPRRPPITSRSFAIRASRLRPELEI